jgi:hypothetical protein
LPTLLVYPRLCQATAEIRRDGVKTAFARWQVRACCRSILYDSTQPTRYDRRHALGLANANENRKRIRPNFSAQFSVRRRNADNMELIDLFFATHAEQELAGLEADKLEKHICRLAPLFQVDIALRYGKGIRLSDWHAGECYFGVYNAPFRSGACSMTITFDQEWTNQGMACYGFYRGDSQAHLRGRSLVNQGVRSVETSIHEWLHYYAHKVWRIDVDEQDQYDYPSKESDSVENGWHHWYTSLLSERKPQRIT